MAKNQFLHSLRSARNFLFHRVDADHAGTQPDDASRRLAHSAVWLTPASVRGFDARDFPELSEGDREDLRRHVEGFTDVAERVARGEPTSGQQLDTARQSFLSIIRTMEPYLPTNEETRKLRDAMRNVQFPPGVLTWEFELGRDSTGDPAVWLWVVVDDAVANDPRFTRVTNALERQIRESLQASGTERWPYVYFRTASEQRELAAAG